MNLNTRVAFAGEHIKRTKVMYLMNSTMIRFCFVYEISTHLYVLLPKIALLACIKAMVKLICVFCVYIRKTLGIFFTNCHFYLNVCLI